MRSRRRLLQEVTVFLISFFGISLVVYFILNGGAYWRELRYSLFLQSPFAEAELKTGEILETHEVVAPSLTAGGYQLAIPKIEVNTPITIPEENTTKSILASLESGVGLYPGSKEPGEPGRIILLGHSSRASWYRGEYAYVFSLLPKLTEFDVFYITGNGKKYTYQVFARKVLTPQETNVFLATTPSDSEVNLVTCYPIGSASKRTIVQAKLIQEENI